MTPDWTDEQKRMMINRAIAFAYEAHKPFHRKGHKEEPYITHPTEAMSVLNNMGLIQTDPNLVIAAILHDIVEDTPTTLEDVRKEFGDDVERLVASHTEDKDQTWEVRKQTLLDDLTEADDRVKLLVMADVLANLRSLYRDVRLKGDTVWKNFKRGKDKQYWYYSSVISKISVLETYDYSKPLFIEMVELFHKVFSE